jgi:hypothetical protein
VVDLQPAGNRAKRQKVIHRARRVT